MTKDSILARVFENRYRLISAYNFSCKETAANCAFNLTNHAITKKYIDSRDAVPGATLRKWAEKRNPPLWACKSAADILLKSGAEARSKMDKYLLVYFFLLNNDFTDSSDAIHALPSSINDPDDLALVQSFFNANIFQPSHN